MPLLIRPIAPYDFSLSCRVFSGGDPAFRSFRNGIFSQVIRVRSDPVVIRIRDVGEEGDTVLAVDTFPGDESRNYCPGDVRRCISHLLGLDDDLNGFYRATEADPVLARINAAQFGLKMPSSETVFEALVTSIIEQQISTPVARKIESRLVRRFGEEVRAAGRTYYAYPRPEDLADADPAALRDCGLSARKGGYITSVACMVRDGTLDLESLEGRGDSDALIRDLCRIKGIGRWTAEFVLLRGLRRLDTFPADDLGIRRAIGNLYYPGEEVSPARARGISRQWGEWKGLAAYYLLVADQHERKSKSRNRGTTRHERSLFH
jgi:DNA-3-methyladenine glycosylase II